MKNFGRWGQKDKNVSLSRKRGRKHRKLGMETLEDRTLLAVFAGITGVPLPTGTDYLVTTSVDGGPGSLRDAIASVEDGGTITFDSGLNGGTITLSLGELTIDKAITIDASNLRNGLTLDANDAGRLFSVTGGRTDRPVEMIHLTLTGGNAEKGGAIYNTGVLTVKGGALTGNKAVSGSKAYGGAIYSSNDLVMEGVEITGNQVIGTTDSTFVSGGGIYINNANGTLTLTSCVIANNSLEGNQGSGGGIYSSSSSLLTDCEITGNRITGVEVSGGGICQDEPNQLTMVGGTVSGNEIYCVAEGNGGGIFASNAILEGITVFNNSLSSVPLSGNDQRGNPNLYGGGIYGFQLTLTNSRISGNRIGETDGDGFGGGIYAIQSEITNALISGNQAKDGGGLFFDLNSNPTLTNCSITANRSISGGGIYHHSTRTLTLQNCVVIHNLSEDATDDIYKRRGSVFGYYNLTSFDDWDDEIGDFIYDASRPLFLDEENGDYSLAKDSQAIDVGNNDFVHLDRDLAGNPRIVNDIVDLGAWERPVSTSFISVTTTDDVIDESDDVCSIREAILLASAGDVIKFDLGLSGKTITLSGTPLLIDKAITIDASELSGGIVINGNQKSRVLEITAGTVENPVCLKNFTITGGNASGENGGGIYSLGALSLTNCVFLDNHATKAGGAIYNGNPLEYGYCETTISDKTSYKTNLLLTGSTFYSNSATYGGAVYNNGSITIDACVFGGVEKGNYADKAGGAIANGLTGTLYFMEETSFTENRSAVGGGILTVGTIDFANDAKLTFLDNRITENDPDFGENITYNRANHRSDWEVVISDPNERAKVKPLTFKLTAESTFTPISTSPLFVDWVEESDATFYLDVDGSGHYLETEATFASARIGLTSGLKEIGFRYETSEGTIDGILKLFVGDDRPMIESISSAGRNRHSITWSNLAGAEGYELAFSENQEDWTVVATLGTKETVTGLSYGSTVFYRIRALSEDLVSEWSEVRSLLVCPLDINGDGFIAPSDLSFLSLAINSRRGNPRWDERCDINADGIVSGSDMTYLSLNWLKRSSSGQLIYPPALSDLADPVPIDLDLSFLDNPTISPDPERTETPLTEE